MTPPSRVAVLTANAQLFGCLFEDYAGRARAEEPVSAALNAKLHLQDNVGPIAGATRNL